MSFADAVKSVFNKYAQFSGRARRSEFWYFTLFTWLCSIVLQALTRMVGQNVGVVLTVIFSLAILIPSLAVDVRRLHDIGKSGWYLLIGLIPLVGWIILLVWACKDSDAGENQYGPSPKE